MTDAPPAPRRVAAVSVVIPAWNAAATIAETLASLQAQHFRNWEAVVIDDGSTDDTSLVAAGFAASDARISIVRQASSGAALARNRGLELIKHPWVLFLDADDWILPEHLERLATLLDSSPEADAAVCGWTLMRDGRAIESEYCRSDGDLFPILARRPAFAGACGYLTGFTCRPATASVADAMLTLPRLEVAGDLSFGAFVRLFDS